MLHNWEIDRMQFDLRLVSSEVGILMAGNRTEKVTLEMQ
jgi:hypothetical protein